MQAVQFEKNQTPQVALLGTAIVVVLAMMVYRLMPASGTRSVSPPRTASHGVISTVSPDVSVQPAEGAQTARSEQILRDPFIPVHLAVQTPPQQTESARPAAQIQRNAPDVAISPQLSPLPSVTSKNAAATIALQRPPATTAAPPKDAPFPFHLSGVIGNSYSGGWTAVLSDGKHAKFVRAGARLEGGAHVLSVEQQGISVDLGSRIVYVKLGAK